MCNKPYNFNLFSTAFNGSKTLLNFWNIGLSLMKSRVSFAPSAEHGHHEPQQISCSETGSESEHWAPPVTAN